MPNAAAMISSHGTAGLQREHEAREQHQHDAEHEVVHVQPAFGL